MTRKHAFVDSDMESEQRTLSIKYRKANSSGDSQRLCPQQRYVKPAKHPGMATFDGDLRQLPVHKAHTKSQAQETLNPALLQSQPEMTIVCNGIGQNESIHGEIRHLPSLHADASPNQLLANNQNARLEFAIDDLKQALTQYFPDAVNNDRSVTADMNDISTPSGFNQKPPSSVTGDDLAGHPATQLMLEVKHIYARMITTDVAGSNPPTLSSQEAELEYDCRALHGLRLALLNNALDFFAITQDATASIGLKLLATRYGMPARQLLDQGAAFWSSFLLVSPSLQTGLESIFERAINCMDFVRALVPHLNDDWSFVERSIYAIKDILLGSVNHHAPQAEYSLGQIRYQAWRMRQKIKCTTFENDLRSWYLHHHPPPEPASQHQIQQLYMQVRLPLKDPVLWALSAWLCFGPCEADTFQRFCKVFTYLAWTGVTC